MVRFEDARSSIATGLLEAQPTNVERIRGVSSWMGVNAVRVTTEVVITNE